MYVWLMFACVECMDILYTVYTSIRGFCNEQHLVCLCAHTCMFVLTECLFSSPSIYTCITERSNVQ